MRGRGHCGLARVEPHRRGDIFWDWEAPTAAQVARRDEDILIVGCSRTEDDLTGRVDTPLPRLIRCVSREAAPGAFHGRITDYLNAEGIDPEATYYVCGSARIVRGMSRIIQAGGARVSYETF